MTKSVLMALVLCAIFGGLALWFWPDMREAQHVDTVTITWVRAKPTACGPNEDDGCAQWSDDRKHCVVTMRADSSDAIVAHEFKHCFGWTHRE